MQSQCSLHQVPCSLHGVAGRRPACSYVARCWSARRQCQQSRRPTVPQAAASGDSSQIVPTDTGFRIEQISFGKILSPIGISLMSYGFGAFFGLLPGGDISSIMLIYGFPISLLGFALAYAQLKPVPCKTTKAAFELRDREMTDIQKQVREDVTRYRYGDEQHLDEALNKVFMFNRAQGIARRLTPILVGTREEVVDGHYALVLEFDVRKGMTEEMWTDRKEKIETFFGPGVSARISMQDKRVELALVSDGSGAGRGGVQQKDVLPPLVPGGKARMQR